MPCHVPVNAAISVFLYLILRHNTRTRYTIDFDFAVSSATVSSHFLESPVDFAVFGVPYTPPFVYKT